jgi:predicted ferric reductase
VVSELYLEQLLTIDHSHTSIFEGEYDPYLWPLVAIWSLDRLLRFVRLVYCNGRVSFSKNMLQVSSSVVTYDQAADIVKIVVTPAHALLRPKPGQFYYLYRPLGWKGWENHPFTLGSFTRPGQVTQLQSQSTSAWNKDILVSEQPITPTSASGTSMDDEHDNTADQPQQLTFWVRPFDGWTKRLAELCQWNADKTAKSKILIEGPYGHSANLHNYESLLLIAGGTGISAVLPYMEEHIHRQANTEKPGMSLRTREIDLLLTSRNPEFIHDLCAKELRPMLSREDIHTSFYSTSAIHTKAHSAEVGKTGIENGHCVQVQINTGRPDITNAILEAARVNVNGGSKAGRLAILVCGPAGMADEARAAVHRVMQEGCRNIEYIEETFGW